MLWASRTCFMFQSIPILPSLLCRCLRGQSCHVAALWDRRSCGGWRTGLSLRARRARRAWGRWTGRQVGRRRYVAAVSCCAFQLRCGGPPWPLTVQALLEMLGQERHTLEAGVQSVGREKTPWGEREEAVFYVHYTGAKGSPPALVPNLLDVAAGLRVEPPDEVPVCTTPTPVRGAGQREAQHDGTNLRATPSDPLHSSSQRSHRRGRSIPGNVRRPHVQDQGLHSRRQVLQSWENIFKCRSTVGHEAGRRRIVRIKMVVNMFD